jgi:hypothetical protein
LWLLADQIGGDGIDEELYENWNYSNFRNFLMTVFSDRWKQTLERRRFGTHALQKFSCGPTFGQYWPCIVAYYLFQRNFKFSRPIFHVINRSRVSLKISKNNILRHFWCMWHQNLAMNRK